MAADPRTVMHEVGSLLDRAGVSGPETPSLREVERVLTDGYACTMNLEAERSRIARQASQLDYDIVLLRALLEELRDYGSVLRRVAKHRKTGANPEFSLPS